MNITLFAKEAIKIHQPGEAGVELEKTVLTQERYKWKLMQKTIFKVPC